MTKMGKTKERLLEVLANDRTDLGKSHDAPTDAAKDEPSSAERFARNLALIQAYEAKKGG